MTPSKNRIGRRQFLQTGAAALAAPAIVPATALGKPSAPAPSERITIGIIGLGSRGFNLIDELLQLQDVQIVAVCDVDERHYRDNPWGKGTAFGRQPGKNKIDSHYDSRSGVSVTSDFRDVCSRDDIDAAVVATPDHWHSHCTLFALDSGKDVYCEKPVTHTFHEGQLVYRKVAKQIAVFQTGTQQRSAAEFRRAVELVRNGHLGRIQRIEVGLPPGYDRPQGDSTITDPPDHLDYNWWCGPAPMLPYMRARHHRWWRGHRAYGGGVLMDWIGHHNDIAHWALDMDVAGPVNVEAVNWTFPDTDVYDTPLHYEIRCEFADGATTSIASHHPVGARLIGDDGWVYVNRGHFEASDPRWTRDDFDVGSQRVYQSDNHVRNFIDCVKSRKTCVAPAETAHRSITPGHLGYVSYAVGRPLRWDAKKEVVVGDDDANHLLAKHSYRDPWG
jgi:predicted dehydrogenase